MNERIQKLAEQAGAVYSNDHAVSLLDDEIEKFAELIVAECISTLDQDDGATHHGELLREHFGVEKQVQDSKELHTCPYREEIHNDYESLCDCDEEQQHQCAMDI
jgi:hypothetical protein